MDLNVLRYLYHHVTKHVMTLIAAILFPVFALPMFESDELQISIINLTFIVPDSLILPLLKERLGKLDCVTRGWILHGFPRSRDQAENLDRMGFSPNRLSIRINFK